MEERFQIGVISSTHGIRGEVKVFPTTDDVKRFKKKMEVFMDTGDGDKLLRVESVKFFKQMVILKFYEYDSINDIERYKGKSLYVSRKNAIPLKEGEYYIADLIGMTVIEDTGELLGTLKDVIETGANDVYEVTMQDGNTILLPAIRECIIKINPEEKEMTVHVMEGLR